MDSNLPDQRDLCTLPVFYYNDLLVSRIGDTIGLNLFEPRYQLMCQRMMHDPRFLFMPNFDNYQCCVGDVGFVIRLSGLHHNGRTYGIQGSAEQMAAVECMWVEPGSQGLHFARFCPLPSQLKRVNPEEVQAVITALTSLWEFKRGKGIQAQFYLEHSSIPDTQLLISSNWDRDHFLLLRSSLPERALESVQQALASTGRPSLTERQVVHVLPSLQPGTPLGGVVREIDTILGIEIEHQDNNMTATARQLALSETRLCSLGIETMNAYFPISSLQLMNDTTSNSAALAVYTRQILESLPYIKRFNSDTVLVVINGTSCFYAPVTICQLTIESVEKGLALLHWRLNSLRIAIIERAHKNPDTVFGNLADNMFQLVCDFVAPKPSLKLVNSAE